MEHKTTRNVLWSSCLIQSIFLLIVFFCAISGIREAEKYVVIGATLFLSVGLLQIRHLCGYVPGGGEHAHRRIRHKHGAWISIDYFAYASKIRHWSPTFKVVLAVVTIILCIALNNLYVSIAVFLSMAFVVIELGGLAIHDYISVLTVPLVFILISILAIVVDFSSYPIGKYCVSLGFTYMYTTPEMFGNGIRLMFKVFAAISALQLMILTTPSTEIIAVLRKTHVPKGFVDLMHLIYRYIFILLDVFARMKNSAESRLGYRDFKTSCFSFGHIASNMLVLSLKKSGAYFDAMEARCYDGELRFLEEEKKADTRLMLPAAVFFVYLILLWCMTRQAVC